MLAVRGSVATYATDTESPALPFWRLLFKNIRVDFLGSDYGVGAQRDRAIHDDSVAEVHDRGAISPPA